MLAEKGGARGSQRIQPGEAEALAWFLMLHGSALGSLSVLLALTLSFSFFNF